METLSLILVLCVTLMLVYSKNDDQPKGRDRRLTVDPVPGKVNLLVGHRHSLPGLLLAGCAYAFWKWCQPRDNRGDLTRCADAVPENTVARRRCGQPIVHDPIAGSTGLRGNARGVGHAPHSSEQGAASTGRHELVGGW